MAHTPIAIHALAIQRRVAAFGIRHTAISRFLTSVFAFLLHKYAIFTRHEMTAGTLRLGHRPQNRNVHARTLAHTRTDGLAAI